MPGWISTANRTFHRPLGSLELAFFWDGRFNGTEDCIHHVELRLLDPTQDDHLFSEANITKAWLSTKRRHPLAGATIKILQMSSGDRINEVPHFFIQEHDLSVLRPKEIIFGQMSGAEEVQQWIYAIWDGPRPLSDDLLARLYVFRETDPNRKHIIHLMVLMAHCVTDGYANRAFMRCLLDTLARGPDLEPPQIPLEERLAMVISLADLEPMHLCSLSPAQRRWRRAIGGVIYQLRTEKAQGGHTLPCRHTSTTPYTPSLPRILSRLLTQDQTMTVLANSRLNGLTFGCAYLALAQVAMTRVLYRRYLRGEISEEEWTYRKKQPHRTFGPFNLRPYLDKPWFERGGGGEVMVSINIFCYDLPFMTLGETERQQYDKSALLDGAPPFSDLLTFNRFLHRAGLVKKQAKAFFSHPLFFEFIQIASLSFACHTHFCALEWAKQVETANGISARRDSGDGKATAVTYMRSVFAHGGSSLGNVDVVFPIEYPLSPAHPLSPLSPFPHPSKAGYVAPSAIATGTNPRIVVQHCMTQLHTRPAELYLGALTSGGRLNLVVHYDGNVYEDRVVEEWLDEVKGAVLWYLCQAH